jgi:DNA-binding response OmpR family regulator
MPGIFGNLGLFKKGNWQPQPNRCEVGMPEQHILLVEDDPDLLSLLTEVLEDEGYRVSAASRRQQARSALRKGNIDLLIADSVLRGGNGDDVAKAAGRRGLPIIMMSGEPDRIARLSGGPLPFLPKPFRAAALLQLIKQLLP